MAYVGEYGADSGGGYTESIALDPQTPGQYCAGGDTWGMRVSTDSGNEWCGSMSGLTSLQNPPHARSTFFSKRPATPGIRFYGVGANGATGGQFYYGLPGDFASHTIGGSSNGFGLGNPSGSPNGTARRPCGQLIDSYVTGGNEYILTLTLSGLHMFANTSSASGVAAKAAAISGTPTTLLTASQIGNEQRLFVEVLDATRAVVINWDHDFNATATQPTDVYLIYTTATNWSGATSGNTHALGPLSIGPPHGRVYEIHRGKDGNLYAAAGYDGVYSVTLSGSGASSSLAWSNIDSGFTDLIVCSVDADSTGVVYAAQTAGTAGSTTDYNKTTMVAGHGVARSNAAHSSWSWSASGSAAHYNEFQPGDTTTGTGRLWWLRPPNTKAGIDQTQYFASMIRVDPFDDQKVLMCGKSGIWMTRNGGTGWYPAMRGVNGGQCPTSGVQIRCTGGNTVLNNNTDFNGASSSDAMRTASNVAYVAGGGGVFTSRTAVTTYTSPFDGAVYAFTPATSSSPARLTRNSTPIHDDRFQGAIVSAVSMTVTQDGSVLFMQNGGSTFAMRTTSITPSGSPPVVAITQPVAGQLIPFGADVLAKATASDVDGDLSTVTVKLDSGSPIAATLVSGVYQHDYGTGLAVGTHTIVYTATDVAGHVATDNVTFSIVASAGSPPVVAITQPANGQVFTQGDDVLAKATASDADSDLSTVTVKLDAGSYLATSLVSGAYQHDYGTALTVGSHSITYRATDAAGNITTTAVAFTVQAPAGNPIVTVQTPVNGSSVSDTGPLAATCTAAGQGGATITGVTSKLDGGSAIAMTLSGGVWSHSYAGPFTDASHTVTFVATDSNANSTTVSTTFTAVSGAWNPTYDLRGNLPLGTLSRAATMQVRSSWSATDGGVEAVRVAKEVVFISGGLGTSAGTGLPYKAQAVAADPTTLWANYEKDWGFPVAADSGGTKFPAKWYAKYRTGGKVQQSGTFVNWLMETGKNTEARASATVDGVTETAYGPWHLKQILAQYATLHALYPQMRFAVWYDTAGTFGADNAPHFWQLYNATTAPSGDPGWNPHLVRPYGQPPVANGVYTDKSDLQAMLWWVGDMSRNGAGSPWAAINTGLYMVCANGAGGAGGGSGNAADIAGHYDMVMAEGWTHKFGTWVAGTVQSDAEGQLQTALDVQLVHGSVFQVLDWAQAGYTAAQFTQFRRVSAAAALISQRTGGGVLWEFANVKSDNPAGETAKDPSLYKLQLGAPLHEPAVAAANYPLGHRVPVGTAAGQASAVGLLVQQFTGGTVVWNYTAAAKTYHAERGLTRVPDLQDTSTPSYAAGAAVVVQPQSAMLFTANSPPPPVAPSNTLAPDVTPHGSSLVGTILATTSGSWTGTLPMTPDYQWQTSADGSTGWTNVTGATAAQFNTTGHLSQYARCGVRETNAAGSSSRVFSNVVGPFTAAGVAPGWGSGSGPTITGSASEGSTLTCVVGSTTGNPAPTATYQWQSSATGLSGSWTNLSGETANTYAVPVGAAGSYLRCNVTLANGVSPNAVKATPSVGPVTSSDVAPTLTKLPIAQPTDGSNQVKVGVPQHGTIDQASIQGTPPFTYAWEWQQHDQFGGGVGVHVASTQDYTPTNADLGLTLRVRVTVSNSAGSATGESLSYGPVVGATPFAPASQTPPVVTPSGPIPQGTILSTTDGSWTGTLPMTPDYQWQFSLDGSTGWTDIAGAGGTNQTRSTAPTPAGRYLRCGVRMTNSVGVSVRVYSNVVGPVTTATSAPGFAAAPTISGQAVEGATLTVAAVQTTGTPTPTATYQWQSSPDAAAWTNIGGATASTLVLPGGSAGTYRRCQVTLSNGNLPNAVAATNSLGPITAAATAPSMPNVPVITLTTGLSAPTVGIQASGQVSGVTGTDPLTYAWEWRSYDALGGGTGTALASTQNYTPVTADIGHALRVHLTVTNSTGSVSGLSVASAPVVAQPTLPTNTARPDVTPHGSSPVGTILSTTTGTWSGTLPMTATIQWQTASTATGPWTTVTGTTNQFATTGLAGKYARSGVRMTNSQGTSPVAFSNAAGPFTLLQAAPVFLDTAVISGEAVEGQTLTVDPGRVSGLPTPTLAYQWIRESTPITDATSASYPLVPADTGSVITCIVTATNGVAPDAVETAAFVGPVVSAATAPNIGTPPFLTWPGSDPQESVAVTIEVPDVTGTPPLTYSYGWERCDALGSNCQVIAGATGQSYAPVGADVGHTLQGSVGISNSVAATSGVTPASPIVVAAPAPPPAPPPISHSLGCGLYDVMILSRGGEAIRHQLSQWTSLTWSRQDGAPGSGTLDLSGLSAADFAACCAALRDVLPWADELAFYRRRANELVGTLMWCGPIGDAQLNTGKAQIPASDLLAWFDVRFVHNDHAWADTDLTEIATALMIDGLAPDPSPEIVLEHSGCGIRGSMTVLAAEYASVGEKLRSLVEQGLRLYTTRRTVTASGYPEDELTFTDSSFQTPPQIKLVGSSQATRVGVTGQPPLVIEDGTVTQSDVPAPQATSRASADLVAMYGLIERAAQTDSTIQESVQGDADRWVAEAAQPVAVVESGVLSQDAAVVVDELLPGRRCRVRLTDQCYQVDGQYRLSLVEGEAAAGTERVTVHFTPLEGGLV